MLVNDVWCVRVCVYVYMFTDSRGTVRCSLFAHCATSGSFSWIQHPWRVLIVHNDSIPLHPLCMWITLMGIITAVHWCLQLVFAKHQDDHVACGTRQGPSHHNSALANKCCWCDDIWRCWMLTSLFVIFEGVGCWLLCLWYLKVLDVDFSVCDIWRCWMLTSLFVIFEGVGCWLLCLWYLKVLDVDFCLWYLKVLDVDFSVCDIWRCWMLTSLFVIFEGVGCWLLCLWYLKVLDVDFSVCDIWRCWMLTSLFVIFEGVGCWLLCLWYLKVLDVDFSVCDIWRCWMLTSLFLSWTWWLLGLLCASAAFQTGVVLLFAVMSWSWSSDSVVIFILLCWCFEHLLAARYDISTCPVGLSVVEAD